MRLTTKLIFSFIFLLLASSLLVTHGCSGKRSGGCPDSAAGDGAVIAGTVNGPTQTHVAGGDCFLAIFTVKDSAGVSLNDTCVEVLASNAVFALHSGAPDCSNLSNPLTAVVAKTDGSGVLSLELLTTPTTSGGVASVTVVSGSATPGTVSTPAASL